MTSKIKHISDCKESISSTGCKAKGKCKACRERLRKQSETETKSGEQENEIL